MEIRRTLEKQKPRVLRASELKVGFCVNLTDSDRNHDTLFVDKISDTEIVFECKMFSEGKNYYTILARDGDKLHDAKGRAVEILGHPIQYNNEGKEL